MRLTLHLLGVEVFDLAFGLQETYKPLEVSDDEFESYQDAGTTGSTPIGFCHSPQPEWERPLNRYDEPAEGDEDA